MKKLLVVILIGLSLNAQAEKADDYTVIGRCLALVSNTELKSKKIIFINAFNRLNFAKWKKLDEKSKQETSLFNYEVENFMYYSGWVNGYHIAYTSAHKTNESLADWSREMYYGVCEQTDNNYFKYAEDLSKENPFTK